VDALDLDASLEESVTVVEWGQGLVESIAGARLEITLERPRGAGESGGSDFLEDAEVGVRAVTVTAHGERWAGLDVAGLVGGGAAAGPGSVG